MPAAAKTAWAPSLGAVPRPDGTFFRVWAPTAKSVSVEIETRAGGFPLERAQGGYFEATAPGVSAGDLYRFRVDGKGPYPDPASRFQPRGVHGPSQVVDPGRFLWSDAAWKGLCLPKAVFYELHLGTFTPEGTFAGAARRLPDLARLGVTAVELMPIAEFPGRWNWGYDGAALFAPSHLYGGPEGLRGFVGAAHALGLAVILDVVYNHFGPDGNYTGVYSPYYLARESDGAWGASVNLGGDGSAGVRAFFLENALHWLHEYHLDGLRFDATHALRESATPLLREVAGAARASLPPGRPVCLIAEDNRNLDAITRPARRGGWGLDAVWSDDFHHQARRLLAGDRDGYFSDFEDDAGALAHILRRGWLYEGQFAAYFRRPRGTSPAGLAPKRFVFFIQNHDQVGNRADGGRLNRAIGQDAYRAACALLLAAAQTPLLFMGQEWGATSPFQYFTDHEPNLGRSVSEGRRREFAAFASFSGASGPDAVPDPQDPATFQRSRLDWSELAREPHAGLARLHRALLRLRREEFAPQAQVAVETLGSGALALWRRGPRGPFLVLVQLRPPEGALAPQTLPGAAVAARWTPLLSTEDADFCADPMPPRLRLEQALPVASFARPGAVVLRGLP